MRRIFSRHLGSSTPRRGAPTLAGAALLSMALAIPMAAVIPGPAAFASRAAARSAARHATRHPAFPASRHATRQPAAPPVRAPRTHGTASMALTAGETFSWIFPLENQANYQVYEAEFADGMWTPLYVSGKGSTTGVDFPQSIGLRPVYSDGNRTVSVTMRRGIRWSDGTPVTTKDVKFFFEVYGAGKKTVGEYIPGELPDDVKSITYNGPYRFTLQLDAAYNPLWFTDNQLTWIVPLPAQAWDRTCATCPNGDAASTPAGAKKVFSFLFTQTKQLGTYATNPLWKTVDGPWRLTGYNQVTHDATFSANGAYSGPTRPHLSSFQVLSFTSTTAELNALRSGSVTFGYVPQGNWTQIPYFKSHGFRVKQWKTFYNEALIFGYTSKQWGPLVRQLYLRQALAHLVNQKLYIEKALHGSGLEDYGSVANYPGSSYVARSIRTDPYPYDPKAASALLTSHGWTKGSGGIDVCRRAGTGPAQCGKGIKKGAQLSLKFLYETDTTAFVAQVSAFATAAKAAGIGIVLQGEGLNTMYTLAGVCPTSPPCNYALAGYAGYLWPYSGNTLLPTGKNQFGRGNFWAGGYTDAKAQRLIDAADHTPGLAPLYADETYLSKEVASLWWPEENTVAAVKNTLHGWTHLSPYGTVSPAMWTLSR